MSGGSVGSTSNHTDRPSVPLWPFYLGGFMGPFAGALVNSIFHEVAAGLNTTLATASTSMTFYMVPMAVAMLFSGTLAEKWGRARSIRAAYALFAVASVVCAVTTAAPVFLAGRSLAGLANAFTTPILIAMIADLTPPRQLGRAIGTFASMQAFGQASAPLVGGFAATWDYRWAFAANAVVAVLLMVVTPTAKVRPEAADDVSHGREGEADQASSQWRALANMRLLQTASAALCHQFTATGVMVLGALVAADRFGIAPGPRGLLVAVFGVAGLVFGRWFGGLADTIGTVRAGCLAVAVLGAAAAAIGVAPSVLVLGALIAVGGAAATGARVLTNTLAFRSTPANRSGATSITMSAQFTGTAVMPLILPLYVQNPVAALGITGASCLLAIAVVVVRPPRGGG